MNRIRPSIVLLVLLALGASSVAQDLDRNLEPLRPLVGREWQGSLASPGGGAAWPTTCRFTPVLQGKALKYEFSTPQIADHAEGYFYWDAAEKTIAVFILHSSGVFKKATVGLVDGLLTVSGRIVFPERSFDFRNSYEFRSDGTMVDRWYQNAFGSWRQGHEIVFAR